MFVLAEKNLQPINDTSDQKQNPLSIDQAGTSYTHSDRRSELIKLQTYFIIFIKLLLRVYQVT